LLLKNPMRSLVLNKKWNPNWAAALLMLISFIVILVPVVLIVMMLTSKISNAADKSAETIEIIQKEISVIENYIGFEISSNINTEKIGIFISNGLESLVGNTFNSIIAISIMYFLLFYMLVDRKQFIESLYTYLPLRPENINIIGNE